MVWFYIEELLHRLIHPGEIFSRRDLRGCETLPHNHHRNGITIGRSGLKHYLGIFPVFAMGKLPHTDRVGIIFVIVKLENNFPFACL